MKARLCEIRDDADEQTAREVHDADSGDLSGLPGCGLSFVEVGIILGEESLRYRANVVDVCTDPSARYGDK